MRRERELAPHARIVGHEHVPMIEIVDMTFADRPVMRVRRPA
jgi:hypothetical protein